LHRAGPERVVALDLIRGVAVLGILVINIAGLAAPTGATLSPHIPAPGSFADELVYAFGLVLFEGKMRALFTILFGASMLLFIERAEAAGRDGDVLQLRRLGWLLLFGCLHFFLFWWGDILFSYALVGIAALFMRELSVKVLLGSALLIFAGWHLGSAAMNLPEVRAEEHVRLGTADPAEAERQAAFRSQIARNAQREMIEYRSGFAEQVALKLSNRPFWLLQTTWPNIGETLPLMLIGMVLYRTGFFTGQWDRRRVRQLALIGTASGLALTLAALAWLWPRGFPPQAMSAALLFWLAVPHLLTAAGYAALLMLAAPRLAATALGRRLAAAGRMAFSNYVGTTIVMTAIFYGWGLGLVGTVDRTTQLGFVLFAWALMLGWSLPWLARFRQGPLEWLWRSLTEGKPLPFRHHAIAIHSQ
jgi:uncharacterized protein